MTSQIDTREGLFEVMAQIAAEREAAKPLVAELLQRDEPPWDEEIPEEWKTAGFVQELTRAAASFTETDPARVLQFLQFGLSVATSLAGNYEEIVSSATLVKLYKEIAFAHEYQDSYAAAERAYKIAEQHAASTPTLEHDVACILLRRAGVLTFLRRFYEAAQLIDRASAGFEIYGDARRIAMADLARGTISVYAGDLNAARESYERLLARLRGTDDTHTLAALYNNLAAVYARLDNRSAAAESAYRARELFTALGHPTHKPEWSLAVTLLSSGDFEKAEPMFVQLRAAFLARNMPEEAALVGLDLVELFIATGRINEGRALTKQIITELTSAGLDDRALTALAYLRDLRSHSEMADAHRARSAVRRLYSGHAFLDAEEE